MKKISTHELTLKVCIGNYGFPSEEMYGYEIAESTGLLQSLQNANAECFFDFGRYAEDCLMDYYHDDEGYVFDSMPATDYYDSAEIDELLGIGRKTAMVA